jgi:hypothetical protein
LACGAKIGIIDTLTGSFGFVSELPVSQTPDEVATEDPAF